MNDDYRKLVGVLRSAVVEPGDGGEATRQRILRDLAAPKRTRHGRLLLSLVAAGLALSSAFALYRAMDAQHLPGQSALRERAADRAAAALPTAREQETPAVQAGPVQESRAVSAAAPSHARKQVDSVARIPGNARLPTRSNGRGRTAAGAEAAPHAASSPPPLKLDEAQQRALYMTAHRLQFRGAPQRALAAWDAYLASTPAGPLVREAQYNRAVILVRLGRRADAERALTPFARGDHGSFRQAEALQLLRALALGKETDGGAL